MKIVIVTGASSGMGREFAKRLAEKMNPDQLWIIARRAERLGSLKNNVSCAVVPISIDLTEKDGVEKYKSILAHEQPFVMALVNAAGCGKIGRAEDLSVEAQSNMIDLNVRALTQVTLLTLPYMGRCSQIYQLASLSSFLPIPYLSVYAATKAYVLSFSLSLGRELKERGIRVMAVCPGWVKTEFLDRATDTSAEGVIGYYGHFHEASAVVERAFRDMRRGKSVSVFGAQPKAVRTLAKCMPHSPIMDAWIILQKITNKSKK